MQITLPTLHKSQRLVAECPARFLVVDAGRRWRKSGLGSVLCIACAAKGGQAWWVAPDYPTAAIGWEMILGLARQIPGVQQNLTDKRVILPSGGWTQVKSADSNLRGRGLNLVVVDEAAHIPKLQDAWEQELRPALSDKKGRAVFISTPKGFNYFHDLYRRTDPDWASFQFPSWDNPYLDPAEIEAAKAELPDLVFRQEYGAEFVQLAGALFRREWFSVIDSAPDVAYTRGWDLAASTKTQADFTAGVKLGYREDGTPVIAHAARGRWEWPDALKVISSAAQADGPGVRVGIEDVGVQKGMYQLLMREPALRGIAIRPVGVHKDKITRASPLLARAEQKGIQLVRGEWNGALIDEFCAFPETDHDDQVDAASIAVQMFSKTIDGPLGV